MNQRAKRKDVLIGTVGKKLDCDVWFDKFEFSKKTGIDVQCSGQRLRKLVSGNYLSAKQCRGRKGLYLMSEYQKAAMIEAGKSNKASKGIKKVTCEDAKRIISDEIEAYIELAERILRQAKLI